MVLCSKRAAFVIAPIVAGLAAFLGYHQLYGPPLRPGHYLERQPEVKQYLGKPVARPERKVYYEGEDIQLTYSLPVKQTWMWLPVDTSRLRISGCRADVRIFRDAVELTDSLADAGGDVPIRYQIRYSKPGTSGRWHVNKYYHLGPGEYWGVIDAGKVSDKFRFRIVPLPDSLLELWNLHVQLHALPHREYTTVLRPAGSADGLRSYARLLLSLPPGAPLRSEGLRFCISEYPTPGDRWYQPGDSLMLLDLLNASRNNK